MQNGDFKGIFSRVEVDSRITPAKIEDVIGQTGLETLLTDHLSKLSGYNHERRRNVHALPLCTFVFGVPGCGKTFNVHAHFQSFAQLYREKGVPGWFRVLSITDFGSKYQNETPLKLQQFATECEEFQGPVAIYVPDADVILQSRSDAHITQEQKQTMGIMFQFFDGTLIRKTGKTLIYADANYTDGIDDATKSRIFDEVFVMERWNKPEYFAQLARQTLEKDIILPVSEEEWAKVGEYLLECPGADEPLSNREIGHALRKITRNYTVPMTMVGAPYEEHEKHKAQHIEGINYEKIITTINEYITTRQRMDQMSLDRKAKDEYRQFMKDLGTKHVSGTNEATDAT